MPATADPEPAAKASPSRNAVFFRRLASTLALWGVVVVAMIVARPSVLFPLLAAVSLIGLSEYYRMLGRSSRSSSVIGCFAVASVYLLVSLVMAARTGSDEVYLADLAGISAVVMVAFISAMRRPVEGSATLQRIAADVFGFVYVVFLFAFMAKLLVLPGIDGDGRLRGVLLALYLIAVTKFTDMGAYSIGSLVGRHKMIPHISPGKTWEGFGGAIFGALLASHVLLTIAPGGLEPLDRLHGTIVAVLLAVVAVFGDLAESVIKRACGSKDSGTLFPGIGGVLDLIDSLCFTAPVFYFYLKLGLGLGSAG